MTKPLASRIALVTGASRGIGRAIAVAFAEAGAEVVALARNGELLAELTDEIAAAGGSASYVTCDITDPDQVSATVESILAAAKHLFPVHGFEGTSMDAIAALANVSKLTVYSHFKDKESLFTEAIREKCMEQMPEELFDVAVDGSIREQFLAIARAFFRHGVLTKNRIVKHTLRAIKT